MKQLKFYVSPKVKVMMIEGGQMLAGSGGDETELMELPDMEYEELE